MKILFDENLSYRLVVRLADIFPGSEHARDLPARDDAGIWQYAKQQGLVIITKDADFVDSFWLRQEPWKLLLVSTGNIRNTDLLALFQANLDHITDGFASFDFIEISRTTVIFHS